MKIGKYFSAQEWDPSIPGLALCPRSEAEVTVTYFAHIIIVIHHLCDDIPLPHHHHLCPLHLHRPHHHLSHPRLLIASTVCFVRIQVPHCHYLCQ